MVEDIQPYPEPPIIPAINPPINPPILRTGQQACIQALYPDAESHRFFVTI
ncbi:MAG: hypothetical protein U5P10_12465 [Spirochaetia bacterium]|nr:hypothetical protein [Spirochaetia bacterium]